MHKAQGNYSIKLLHLPVDNLFRLQQVSTRALCEKMEWGYHASARGKVAWHEQNGFSLSQTLVLCTKATVDIFLRYSHSRQGRDCRKPLVSS